MNAEALMPLMDWIDKNSWSWRLFSFRPVGSGTKTYYMKIVSNHHLMYELSSIDLVELYQRAQTILEVEYGKVKT